MRKVHIALGNLVYSYLNDITNGKQKVTGKKLSKNLNVWICNGGQFFDPHEITTLHKVKHFVQVRYCNTNIITVGMDANGIMHCYIDNGGYNTPTTKNYINVILSTLGLPYYIRIKNYRMQLVCESNGVDEVVSDFDGSYLISK